MRYRFGSYQLDTERFELLRSGEKLAVRPKVFDMLRYLLERAGRVVTKSELLDALWAGQVVDETSVPWTMGHARRAIGQTGRKNTPIETVHARGYRWTAPLEVEAPEVPSDSARPGPPFVGREPLMAALVERLRDVKAGRGGMCLLTGDAGIGKTRCLDELAKLARAQGHAVWSGRSVQNTLAPVYFPWIQLLQCAEDDATTQAAIQPLLARLRAVDTDNSPSSGRDVVLGRLALFEGLSRFLIASAQRTPLLLVLDDLHWADAGTLEILSLVAAELRNSRVLVVGASRGPLNVAEVRGTHELMRHAERFELQPLSVDSVAEYVRALSAGPAPERELCEAVHRASAGYPLFVQETVRGLLTLHDQRALASLPVGSVQPSEQARNLLQGRLSAMDGITRRVLACASVLGEQFEVPDLFRLADGARDEVLPALDSAVEHGFILAAGVHRFQFRHALFRELVYEDMPSDERMRYHRAIAQMRQQATDATQRRSEIAYHHYRSLALGDYAQVRTAALEAAQAAARAQAFVDAAQFCAWGLEASALHAGASKREYAELLLLRAQAQGYAGWSFDAHATIEQLVEVAYEQGYCDLLVQAARALRTSHAMGTMPDALARRALERALELLPETENALRLQALCLLAWLPPDAWDLQRSKALSAHALELARSSGSRDVLVEALNARLYALCGPDDIDALLTVSDEMLRLDHEPRGWISVEAYNSRHFALLQRGDLAGADAANTAIEALANARGFLELRWHHERHRAQRRFLAGDFAAAEADFTRLRADAKRMNVTTGPGLIAIQRALLVIVPEGPTAFKPAANPAFFRELLLQPHVFSGYRSCVARLALAFGQTEPAKSVLEQLSADDFRALPKDIEYLNALCNLALVAIGLADRPRVEQLFAVLEPYAHFNTPNLMGMYEGPVSHFLAMLAAFLERKPQADEYFAHAIAMNERLGLRPLLARSAYEHARFLLHTGRGVQAAPLRDRALSLSDELGLKWLGQQARELALAGTTRIRRS